MGVGTVGLFSALLAVVPLAVFFAAKHGGMDAALGAVLGADNLTDSSRLIVSGVLGVVCVNLVVALFLVVAWQEPPPSPSKEE